MPTRMSASVGDHPCFLTFYYYKYKEKFVIHPDMTEL